MVKLMWGVKQSPECSRSSEECRQGVGWLLDNDMVAVLCHVLCAYVEKFVKCDVELASFLSTAWNELEGM